MTWKSTPQVILAMEAGAIPVPYGWRRSSSGVAVAGAVFDQADVGV
ncbi:MAG: hypothetical protein ACQSGP_13150 [Frankia sp.]